MAETPNKTDYTFTSDIRGGTNISGQVTGGQVVQGPQYNYYNDTRLPTAPNSGNENLSSIQILLQKIYAKSYRSVIPVSSADFYFDIKEKWVNLTLKLEGDSAVTDNYTSLLKKAFADADMLIIEGDPENQQNKGMHMPNIAWEICIKKGKVCLNRMKKLSNGTRNQQNKVMNIAKTTWEICIEMGTACINHMKKLLNENQQNKETHVRNIIWVSCIAMAKVYINQTKKLSNGTEKQQNKEIQMRNIIWVSCIAMAKVYINLMKTLSNGTEKQQNKEIQMRNMLLDICTVLGEVYINQTKKL
uniref:Uncharacterized protein n=1 Tax=Plectus sambesii TaxID=2011161 RepID=A0A914UIZ5_9BILA